jgi:hypothetical protein
MVMKCVRLLLGRTHVQQMKVVKQYSGVAVIVNVCCWKVILGTPFLSQSDIKCKGESVASLVDLMTSRFIFVSNNWQ